MGRSEPAQEFRFSYDFAGNRLTEQHRGFDGQVPFDVTRHFFYNALNELMTVDPDPEAPATFTVEAWFFPLRCFQIFKV